MAKMEDSKENNLTKYAKPLQSFSRLLGIMDELREKCPWDKKQTFDSLRHLTIEETYELADAIFEKKYDDIKKELGDLALHIVFYAKIAEEQQRFDINDVLTTLTDKLITRHPHIYGTTKADNEEDVKKNWEQIKLREKGGNKTILGGVPNSLPAMIKAMRIQEKAKASGFDWENKHQVWEKVEEEIKEFKAEFQPQDVEGPVHSKMEAEFGDLLFSLINYARFVNINPEDALEKTNRKFISRFNYLEAASTKDGKKLNEMTLPEMDAYWEEAKKVQS